MSHSEQSSDTTSDVTSDAKPNIPIGYYTYQKTGKTYYNVTATKLLIDSTKLAKKVYDSLVLLGKRPTHIIALWRGGTPVAMPAHEFFKRKGETVDHIAVRTGAYKDKQLQKVISVDALEYVVDNCNANDCVVIFDDIFDSGRSIEKLLDTMQQKMRKNMPKNIIIATTYFKPSNSQVSFGPNFWCDEIDVDAWVVFPHEYDIPDELIRLFKGDEIYNLLTS